MAVILTKEEEEKAKVGSGAPGFTTSAASTAESTSEGASEGQAPSAINAPKSSGWTNLQDYLGANKGEGQKIATTIGGEIAQEGTTETADVVKATDKAITGMHDANTRKDSSQMDESLKSGSTFDKEGFTSFFNNAYAPVDEYDTGKAGSTEPWKGIQDAASSQGGRAALLSQSDSTKRDNYGSGMQGFDSFLMGAGDLSASGGTTGTDLAERTKGVATDVGAAHDTQQARWGTAVAQRTGEIDADRNAFRNRYDHRFNEARDAASAAGQSGVYQNSTLPVDAVGSFANETTPDWGSIQAKQDRWEALGALTDKGTAGGDVGAMQEKYAAARDADVANRAVRAAALAKEKKLAAAIEWRKANPPATQGEANTAQQTGQVNLPVQEVSQEAIEAERKRRREEKKKPTETQQTGSYKLPGL